VEVAALVPANAGAAADIMAAAEIAVIADFMMADFTLPPGS
jgi:hypothetical protein